MKKIWTLLFTTILVFSMGPWLSAQGAADQGQEEFVNFLVKNKDMLGYDSFGTFEHEDWTEVRVYCSGESRKKIEENLSVFSYKEAKYKGSDTGSGTLFVMFSKGGAVAAVPAKPAQARKKKCPRKVFVEFETIRKKPFDDYEYFEKGLSDGGTSVLYSPAAGEVAKVFLNAGDKVDAGDIILNFDLTKLEAQIAEAEQGLSNWQTNLRKRRQWKVRSARAELQAENKVKEYEAELARLKARKGMDNVTAEKSGQIISIVESGTVLDENDEVAKILDNSVMKMEFTDEESALLISKLDTLSVRFNGLDGIRTGKVRNLKGRVFVEFDNSDMKLSSKSIGKFKVLLKSYDSAVVLNKNTVKKDASGNYVYLVQKKRAKKVYIQTGPEENGKVVILSGLNEGDPLITTDDECLADGKKIKFTQPAPSKKKASKEKREATEKKVKPEKKKRVRVKKLVKKEEPVVQSNEVRFQKKRGWSDLVNCPSTLKVKTRIMKKEGFFGYETFESGIASGAIETVLSETDSIVAEVNAAEGDSVARGQLLITLDVEDMKRRLENARSSLEEWKKLLADIGEWTERSENLENELKEKIRKISLQIPKLTHMISNAGIYSPNDGIVSFIAGSGDRMKEGDVLVKIEDKARVFIPLNVPDVSRYNEDMKVEVSFEGIAGTFKGTLKKSGGKLVAVVDNYSKALTGGMKAEVNILREYRDVIVANKSEILRDDEGYFGYVAVDERARRVALVPGSDKGSRMMILSGLNEGDELIISGFDCLEDGKKIKLEYLNAATGKYVIKRTQEEIEDMKGKLFLKKMGVGLGAGMYMVSDEVFTDVYGSSAISGVFSLSFNLINHVELFADVWYIPKAGSTEAISKVNLSMFSFYLGAKYQITWMGKFLPYIGVAMNSLAVKEQSDELDLDTAYRTSVGFSAIGGFYYKLKENMNIKFDVRYDFTKMEIEEFESELDFSGIKVAIGFVLRF